jgi:hypothetical protein
MALEPRTVRRYAGVLPLFQAHPMLQMRPGCECCDTDLAAVSTGAWICSFECTFCSACAQGRLGGRCPNCGGALCPRPTREGGALERNPASPVRVFKPASG